MALGTPVQSFMIVTNDKNIYMGRILFSLVILFAIFSFPFSLVQAQVVFNQDPNFIDHMIYSDGDTQVLDLTISATTASDLDPFGSWVGQNVHQWTIRYADGLGGNYYADDCVSVLTNPPHLETQITLPSPYVSGIIVIQGVANGEPCGETGWYLDGEVIYDYTNDDPLDFNFIAPSNGGTSTPTTTTDIQMDYGVMFGLGILSALFAFFIVISIVWKR